ncbi:MAG: type II toxin-antitoxin system VapC family toxin [Janthinobacterium lividum]
MRLLLDTHIFIWFVLSPSQLSVTALAAIQSGENQIFLSLASAWEMSIKSGLGKLNLTQPIEPFIVDQAQRNRFEILPITLPHIAAVERLPQHHRDPFGRLLIAQSLSEAMPIISADHAFDPYPISLLR